MKYDKTLESVIKERYVHTLSSSTYDKVAALWHIDKESEEIMAGIASKVVLGMFCLEYLSHIQSLLKERALIEEDITAADLSNGDLIDNLKYKLSGNKEIINLFKNTARHLKKLLDSSGINNLEDLTKAAHTGDYLLASLQDMKESGHDEYALWLASVPSYYEKDLRYIGLLKTGMSLSEYDEVAAVDSQTDYFWNEQFPVELLHNDKIYANYLTDLNPTQSAGVAKEKTLPCVKPKTKNRRYSPKTRS